MNKKVGIIGAVLSASILLSGVSEASANTTTTNNEYHMNETKKLSMEFYSNNTVKHGQINNGKIYIGKKLYTGNITTIGGTNYKVSKGLIYNPKGKITASNRFSGMLNLKFKTKKQKNSNGTQFIATKYSIYTVDGKLTHVKKQTNITN